MMNKTNTNFHNHFENSLIIVRDLLQLKSIIAIDMDGQEYKTGRQQLNKNVVKYFILIEF